MRETRNQIREDPLDATFGRFYFNLKYVDGLECFFLYDLIDTSWFYIEYTYIIIIL